MFTPTDSVVQLAAELIGIASVNPSLVPGAAGEAPIVAALEARLRAAGFETSVIGDDRPSLIALAPGDGPIVVLNGHLDTVGVDDMPDPFAARIERNRMYGRGAADMKGGVAALVVAAEELLRRGSGVRPLLALVADEEDASLGSEAVIAELERREIRPALCVIAEPTDCRPCRSLRGFAVVDVAFAGVAAHSSQAELGVNAVNHLGRFLGAIDARATVLQADGGDLMVTMVGGGRSPFVIPDAAHAVVELRTPPGMTAEPLAEVEALLDPSWNATARLRASRPSWQVDDSGAAAAVSQHLADRLETALDFDAPYWMEAPLWQQLAPTVICGPSGGGLHAADEWLDLDQLRAFTAALVAELPRAIG